MHQIWSSSYAWERHGLGGRETAYGDRVSLVACWLSCWKSIVLLRDPFFLVQMTILWHQVLLEVNSPPEGPILLGADDHSVAPSVRGPQGDLLEDSQVDVPVQAHLDLVLPLDGYWDWGVAWFRCGCGVDVQGEGWARHHGEGLVLAYVKASCRVEVPEVVTTCSASGHAGLVWVLVAVSRTAMPCGNCSGAASGRCTWRGSGTALMQCGKSRPSVWFPGL